MRGINSECIDLIYLDPPFNSKKKYKAPIGSPAEGAEFKDIWTDEDIKNEWHGQIAEEHEELYQIIQASEFIYDKSMKIYLMAMAVRLFEMKRILKPTGSVYLHCDPTGSHYLKMLMDSIFGHQNFRNEIVWCYTRMSAKGQRQLSRAHDTILWYSMGSKWHFNVDAIRLPYAKGSKAREGHTLNRLGSGYAKEGVTKLNPLGKFPEDWITHVPYLRGKNAQVGQHKNLLNFSNGSSKRRRTRATLSSTHSVDVLPLVLLQNNSADSGSVLTYHHQQKTSQSYVSRKLLMKNQVYSSR